MIGTISSDFPELLISISTSFFVILPKSPCKQSFADNEKAGLPTEEKVEAIFCDYRRSENKVEPPI